MSIVVPQGTEATRWELQGGVLGLGSWFRGLGFIKGLGSLSCCAAVTVLNTKGLRAPSSSLAQLYKFLVLCRELLNRKP